MCIRDSYQGAVEQQQWLSAAQMMDGLALGETTPGPLIMVVAFVGFLAAWSQPFLAVSYTHLDVYKRQGFSEIQ